MSDMIELSDSASAPLHLRPSGRMVDVTDESRPGYRGLASAGLMIPLHTLIGGVESAYRSSWARSHDVRRASRDFRADWPVS
jgi:hypothetical protein